MNDTPFSSRLDPNRRLAELRQHKNDVELIEAPEEELLEVEEGPQAFSLISANRQKFMCEFRFVNGNAKALSYSYLVSIDFDASTGIALDYSGYSARITGRNLRPIFDALTAHRVAMIQEMDELQAKANLTEEATVVTKVVVTNLAEE